MSTTNLSYQTDFSNVASLTNTIATNLYLYGLRETPIDLNDRIRPVVAANRKFANNDGPVPKPNAFDIQVNLYDSTFFTTTGPGRFSDPRQFAFLQAFFDDRNWGSEYVPGVGTRTYLQIGLAKVYYNDGGNPVSQADL